MVEGLSDSDMDWRTAGQRLHNRFRVESNGEFIFALHGDPAEMAYDTAVHAARLLTSMPVQQN